MSGAEHFQKGHGRDKDQETSSQGEAAQKFFALSTRSL